MYRNTNCKWMGYTRIVLYTYNTTRFVVRRKNARAGARHVRVLASRLDSGGGLSIIDGQNVFRGARGESDAISLFLFLLLSASAVAFS